MKSKLSKSCLGFLWGVFVLSFPLHSVMAQEQLWHRVEKDANVYDIWVDCSEQLNGRFIGQGDITQQKINYIRVAQDGIPVQNFPLIKEIVSIAENAAYMASTPFAGFIDDNHLDSRTRDTIILDEKYTYYALPTHCDLGFLTVGLDTYHKRKDYYFQALVEVVAQPRRYEQLNQEEYLTFKLEALIRNGATAGGEISSTTEMLISQLTETDLWYYHGAPIQIQVFRGSDGQKLFDDITRSLNKNGQRLDFLNKLQNALKIVNYGGSIYCGALRKMFIESCITLPESMERLDALEFYINSLSKPDPAMVAAFDDVKDYYEYSQQNYDDLLINAIQEAAEWDNVITLAGIVKALYLQYNSIGWGAGVAKALSGWFLAATWTLEFWGELDHANVGIMGATLERGIGEKFVNEYSPAIDLNDILDYDEIKAKSTLPSIQTYGGYLFYQNIADNIMINPFNPYDWAKYIDYLEPFVGGTNPSQKVEFFESQSNYCLNWGNVKWVDNLHFLGPSFNVGSDSIYDALAKLALVPDFEIPDTYYVSITPAELSSPGTPIDIEVSVLNKGISDGDAEVRITFDALYASFASGQTSTIKNIASQGVEQFNLTIDTTNFLPDNYNIIVEVVNRDVNPESDEKNNAVSFGYSVGGTEPAFLKAFPLIEIAQSIPGREYHFLLDVKKYFYDDNPEDVIIKARGYSNLVIDIDANGMAYIRGKHNWSGPEKVTFIIKDPNSDEYYQHAYITITPVENEMQLTNGIVTPASGISGTIYEYKVNYKDLAGRFPQVRSVYINGISHTMKWSGTPIKDGSEFTFTRVGREIPTTGDNTYCFLFGYEDQIVRFPLQSLLDGPDISITHDVAITGLQINPDEPRQDQLSNISFRVENMGSVIEYDLIARLFVDGNEVNSVSVGNLCVADSSKVITFVWTPPVRDDAYEYQLTTLVDVVGGEVNIANNSQSLFLTVEPEYGQITGWVFDQFNDPIEGASVKVISTLAEEYGSAKTDHDGWFVLDGLMPGLYDLEAYKDGEGNAVQTDVEIHSLQSIVLNQNFIIFSDGTELVTSTDYPEECEWSPDGSKIAFRHSVDFGSSTETTIAVVNEDGSGYKRFTGPDKSLLAGQLPKWSPDGNYILFKGYRPSEGYKVWKVSANGNGANPVLIINKNVNRLAWSPEGNYIAYTDPVDDQIWRVTKTGGSPTQLSTSGRAHGSIDWSPDGTKIVFTSTNQQLWIFNVADATEYAVFTDRWVYYPTWLPDSSGIIYTFGGDIWVSYLDSGDNIPITFDPLSEIWPTVPKNEPLSKLAYISKKGFTGTGIQGIFKKPFTAPVLYFKDISVQPDPFTPNGDGVNDELDISYAISRDAYVTLKIHDSQGNLVKTLLDNEFQEEGAYTYQWDGVNYKGDKENAEAYSYRIDMHDDNNVAIPAHGRFTMLKDIWNLGQYISFPRWSPDGNELLYFYEFDQNLYICEPNGANKQLINTPYEVSRESDWFPDGQHLIFSSKDPATNKPQIARIKTDGTGYEELTEYINELFWMGSYPCVSATGDNIVFTGVWEEGDDNYRYITKMNSDGSNMVTVGDYRSFNGSSMKRENPKWSPDSNSIVYSADKNDNLNMEIYLLAQDGSWEEQLTNNPYTDIYPEFTSDGQRILFGSARKTGGGGTDLWTLPVDGNEQPKCIARNFAYGMPSNTGDKISVADNVIELFLSLTKGAIEGKVLEEQNLSPVAGASVSLIQGPNSLMQTVTNEQGAYQFLNVEPGLYTVDVNASGYAVQTEVAESLPWYFTRNIDFALTTTPTVQVTSIETNEIIQGSVQLFGEGTSSNVAQVLYQYAAVDTQSEMLIMQTTAQATQSYNWITIGTSDPYHPLQWDVSTLSSGEYLIRSVAQDEFGNSDSSPEVVSITIDSTAPLANILNIDNNDIITGIVELEAVTTDNDVSSIRFDYKHHNDIIWTTIDSCYFVPYTISWNTQNLFYNEVYDLRAVAIDTYGNEDQSPGTISVTVTEPVLPEQCDFNNDGIVNFIDFAHFAAQWLRLDCNEGNGWCEQCDLNKMGTVDFDDLLIFTENWLWKAPEKIPDFDQDGKVDFKDYAILAGYWMDTCFGPDWCGGSDLDEDGVADLIDLSTLAQYWLWQLLEGDIDDSGTVNFEDLRLLANKWLWSGSPGAIPEDIIQDGVVNFIDFSIMASHWLESTRK